MMFKYPSQLMAELKRVEGKPVISGCSEPKLALPKDSHLSELLEVAYHASFLTEETRRIGFRLVYFPKYEWTPQLTLPAGHHDSAIPFRNTRPFSVSEVMRLAPAADYRQMLICVGPVSKSLGKKDHPLRIWGLIHEGSAWWEFVRGIPSSVTCPPNRITVSSTEPGSLSVSLIGLSFLRLRQGQVFKAAGSILHGNGPVGSFFADASKQMQKDVDAEYTSTREMINWKNPITSYLHFLQITLFHILDKAHGGTLIVVSDKLKHTDSRLADRINIKYQIDHQLVWGFLKKYDVLNRKYYDLEKNIRKQKKKNTEALFEEYTHVAYLKRKNENDIVDAAKFVASLSGVDGAVVMTDRYRILGFGGEVLATSPSLEKIRIAKDERGKKGQMISIESFGTRHRSAFRICSNYEDCLSFIVSQDGGIKAVKRLGPDVVIWPDININSFVI